MCAQLGDRAPAAEPAGRDLERLRAPVGGAGRSPRRRARRLRAGSASAASTTSGTRAVTSSRLRVKTRDVARRARWTCTRAPSSFHSTAAGLHARERVGHVGGGRGEHRLQRAADLEPERRQPRGAVGEGGAGHRAEVAAQHQRAAHRGARHVRRRARRRRPSRRPGRPGAARRVSSAAQEALLGLGRAGEQRARAPRAAAPASRARRGRRCARRRASTSPTVSDGSAAGGRDARAATPSRRRSGAGAARR